MSGGGGRGCITGWGEGGDAGELDAERVEGKEGRGRNLTRITLVTPRLGSERATRSSVDRLLVYSSSHREAHTYEVDHRWAVGIVAGHVLSRDEHGEGGKPKDGKLLHDFGKDVRVRLVTRASSKVLDALETLLEDDGEPAVHGKEGVARRACAYMFMGPEKQNRA